MFKFLILILTILLFSNSAFAFCMEPLAPDPPNTFNKPEKPFAPYCVNEFTKTHTCNDWEISSYNSELEEYQDDVNYYIQDLKNYIKEAELYYEDVVSYAKCEVRNLD